MSTIAGAGPGEDQEPRALFSSPSKWQRPSYLSYHCSCSTRTLSGSGDEKQSWMPKPGTLIQDAGVPHSFSKAVTGMEREKKEGEYSIHRFHFPNGYNNGKVWAWEKPGARNCFPDSPT